MEIINGTFQLEKFKTKGGWTYVALPGLELPKNNPFGWVRVNGFIDDFELDGTKLMPMRNGELFLPVKASIRKKIKKEAGDSVAIILILDESEIKIPEEIVSCIEMESKVVNENFHQLSADIKRKFINWIYNAPNEEEKALRIIGMIEQLEK